MNVDDLTDIEKIGQMFMFGVNSSDITPIYDLVRNFKIGGVILYKKNYSSYEEMINVINKLKEANKNNRIPLFIALDQECGRVNRFPNEIHNIKNVYDLSLSKDKNVILNSCDIISLLLNKSGINMNFAPVLDIYNDSKLLYKRCFSSRVDVVMDYGISYMQRLKENNIISVVKHFPGHGMSKSDSHMLVPYVFDKKKFSYHVKPFLTAFDFSCDALMVGHLIIRGMSGYLPCSISKKFITNYLRKKCNYDGLVVTDDIRMMALSLYRFNILKRVFNSGSDIILFKYKKGDDKVINKVVNMYKKKSIDNELINRSVDRILMMKRKYNINDDVVKSDLDIDYVNSKIDCINNFLDK